MKIIIATLLLMLSFSGQAITSSLPIYKADIANGDPIMPEGYEPTHDVLGTDKDGKPYYPDAPS